MLLRVSDSRGTPAEGDVVTDLLTSVAYFSVLSDSLKAFQEVWCSQQAKQELLNMEDFSSELLVKV